MERQPREHILGQVYQSRRGDGDRGAAQADDEGQRVYFPTDFGDACHDGECCAAPQDELAHDGRDDDCGRDRNQAAGPPLEQQQLDGQQNGCQRSVERRRHAAGGTGNKQRFSFICGQVQVLSQDRTERPAGHDDGSLSAERATGADADRRRNRLEHSNFGFDAAAPGENGLNGLGHPMTANLVRTEPRHPARRPDRRRRGRPVSATTDGVALPAPQARWSNVGRRQDWSPVRST